MSITTWVGTLIIISTITTVLYSYTESKNNEKIAIALQSGITMLQDLSVNSVDTSILTHNLIVMQQDCGYLNLPRNNNRCIQSGIEYNAIKNENERIINNASTSSSRYTKKVGDLADNYDFYNNWGFIFMIITLCLNALALILNNFKFKSGNQ